MKMTLEAWDKVLYFTVDEKWGDPLQMEVEFISKLDRFRKRVRVPFIIHCGYETTGHSANSEHGNGNACDGHIYDFDLLDIYIAAEREGFRGIGCYDWGIHLDNRIGDIARWCRIDGQYKALTAANLDVLRGSYKYKGYI